MPLGNQPGKVRTDKDVLVGRPASIICYCQYAECYDFTEYEVCSLSKRWNTII